MEKRGQITIFIILGIAMLIALLMIFFLRSKTVEQPAQVAVQQQELLDEPAQQVKDYVQQCLAQEANTGIEVLGLQGGFIYAPLDSQSVAIPSNRIIKANGNRLTVADGAGSNNMIYWITDKKITIPSQRYMEQDLENYLKASVPECADFKVFQDKAYGITTGNITVNVTFSNQAIVDIKWPTTISFSGKNYDVKDYNYVVPVNMQLIHSVALDLAANEMLTNYLEEHAKSLISLFGFTGGEKGPNDLPPVSFPDTNTDCKSVTWTKDEAKTRVQRIFQTNYPYLKIAGSNFTRVTAKDKLAQGTFDSFIWTFLPNLSSIHINYTYLPVYGMDFDIKPSTGNLVAPDKASQSSIPFLSRFCVYDYKFKYFIRNPIVTKITDSRSATLKGALVQPGKGFNFYFPMMLFLCGNQARNCTGPNPYDDANLTSIFGTNVTNKIYDCSKEGAEITLSTLNNSGFLPGVAVSEKCEGMMNECDLGVTDDSGLLKVKIAQCEKPQLKLDRADYALIIDDIRASYRLQKVKNYSLTIELVSAKQFLENYYLTSGFTKSSCDGKMPDQMLEATKRAPATNDTIMMTIQGNSETPTIVYPQMKNMFLSGGDYEVNTAHASIVTIQPSYFGDKDNIMKIGFGPGNTNLTSFYPLGTGKYQVHLKPEDLKGNKIKMYALTEHFSDEALHVNDFDNPVIQDTQLIGKVTADENCDGIKETTDVTIDEADYSKFLAPEFS